MTKLAVFTKEDCPHCPAAKTVVESVVSEVTVNFHDLDTPDGMAQALKFGVRGLPTIILLDDDEETDRWSYPELPTEEDISKLI